MRTFKGKISSYNSKVASMLVTTLRSWWLNSNIGDRFFTFWQSLWWQKITNLLILSPKFLNCHNETNIKLPPTWNSTLCYCNNLCSVKIRLEHYTVNLKNINYEGLKIFSSLLCPLPCVNGTWCQNITVKINRTANIEVENPIEPNSVRKCLYFSRRAIWKFDWPFE